MSKKQNKKDKKKFLKMKQKEIEVKNKEKVKHVEVDEEIIEILDCEDITSLSGTKGYATEKLSKVIENLKDNKNNDVEILSVARGLREFSVNTTSLYNNFLNSRKKKLSKTKLNIINRGKYNLNLTERAVLKFMMMGIEMEYGFKECSHNIDYSGIKLYFETTYKLLMLGLKDKKLRCVDMYVGYGDELCDLKIEYCEDEEKYNLNNHIVIPLRWEKLDHLYDSYIIYKTKYKYFSETNLQSLATANATKKDYESRENGQDLLSYNGIALNYVGVLESELKKLVSKKFNLNERKLKLVDAINYLAKCDHDILSREETINKLHEIRLLRNKVAHGGSISYEEFYLIHKVLFDMQILEFISWNMFYLEEVL